MATQYLLEWYDNNKRSLPWRENRDPYRIWVSEIMLQQTRVEAAIPYYLRFMERFPDVSALASAPLDDVYKAWEGLGYYSRARMLHLAAIIIADGGGIFPTTAAGLRSLPGIGPYTAGAIASIAFGEPVAAIDGNVLRVFARLYACHEPIEIPSVKRKIEAWVMEWMDRERPGDFNQALMELGAVVCIPGIPRCEICPVSESCIAYAQGDTALPVRLPKKEKTIESLFVAVILSGAAVLVRRRPAKGLLAGFWEFPHFANQSGLKELRIKLKKVGDLPDANHVFTHRIWQMHGALYRAEDIETSPDGYKWVSRAELDALHIPSAMSHWLACAREALT